MRILCWSIWLVGICLTDAVHAAPLTSQDDGMVRDGQVQQWQTVDVPGGVRLALAKRAGSSRFGLCLGFEAQSLARDGKASLSELIDLERRSESLAELYRTHEQKGGSAWSRFTLTEGATHLECLSVPTEDSSSALLAVLETLHPLSLTTKDCNQTMEQWRQHVGLARWAEREWLAQRARELAWLGSRPQQHSIANAIREADLEACRPWRVLNASNPSIVSLAVIGDIDIASTEKAIRNHPSVRQRQRNVRPQVEKSSPPLLKLPEPSFPRFVRIRSPQSAESSLMFVWPIVRQSERHDLALHQIASLIERRLNRAWGPHTERRASVRLQWGSRERTLGIEVRPTTADELASTEERIFAVLEQLHAVPVSSAELETLRTDGDSSPPVTGDLDLDQALRVAQKLLFSWKLRVMVKTPLSHPSPIELQHWAREGLTRQNVTELLCESTAPKRIIGSTSQGQPPKGFAYLVKAGESLQMIARKFRVTIADLIRVNHLHHPDQVAPGTRLTIPSSPRATPSN